MRIGVLGCGYVAQACAQYWKNSHHFVTVTTRQPSRLEQLSCMASHVELLTESSLAYFLEQQEVVLISVAPTSLGIYQDTYYSTYLQTAQQVVEKINNNSSCLLKQIIYTSSTSVYGEQKGKWVDEHTKPASFNEKTCILLETEKLYGTLQSSQLAVCIYRLGEIYGPERLIEIRLQKTNHTCFPGTGQNYTNLIHLTDIIRACEFARLHHLSGIFNLCNDFHMPRNVFYEQICQKQGFPSIIWDTSKANIHGGNKRVSNEKIKKIGFSFQEPLYKI